MTQRMNAQFSALAQSGADAGDLRQLVENPNAFLQPTFREVFSPDVIAAFQSMLGNALHDTFVVGTAVSVLALVSVAMMPAVRLTRPQQGQ